MKKSLIVIIVSVLVLAALGIGAFFFFQNNDVQVSTPVPKEIVGYQFPSSAEEINWEDRDVFIAGLVPGAVDILNQLPEASTYFIEINIPDVLGAKITGHQIVRFFNSEEQQLNEIYFRLFPNYQGGGLEVSRS